MISLSVVGLMSGSSLDGIDLAWCDFVFDEGTPRNLVKWSIRKGNTIAYSSIWKDRLSEAPTLDGKNLWQLHSDLGHLYGEEVRAFLQNFDESPDFIASHGHTIFHYPSDGTTTQIGEGAAIAAELGMIVIDQFRSLDVALGGQGAPLAPLADKYLFPEYFACLNLGGIANLSVKTPNGYIAFDNGGANQILNALTQELGLLYDDGGQLARKGKCLPELLNTINKLPFFHKPYPKSLGNDWVRDTLLPYFQNKEQNLEDRLHTACIQLAEQIGRDLELVVDSEQLSTNKTYEMLVTGGGAFNTFLCELIENQIAPVQLVQADHLLINFKESALIALAGALRWLEQANVLPSVTGAKRSSVGGAIHYGLSPKK